jgi:hypothetical protein
LVKIIYHLCTDNYNKWPSSYETLSYIERCPGGKTVKEFEMAMDPIDREPNVYNRETTTNVVDRDGRGSNTLAYLIGGLVIALGLLAFLFYDGDNNDVSTTGSTGTQTESSTGAGSAGSAGSGAGSTTAPSSPTTPAPASPAAPKP